MAFVAAVAVLGVSIAGIAPLIRIQFFPDDYNLYYVFIEGPANTPIETVDERVRAIATNHSRRRTRPMPARRQVMPASCSTRTTSATPDTTWARSWSRCRNSARAPSPTRSRIWRRSGSAWSSNSNTTAFASACALERTGRNPARQSTSESSVTTRTRSPDSPTRWRRRSPKTRTSARS